MSGARFVLVTDAEGQRVAVNLAMIEVVEERRDVPDETWIQTAQHAVVVAKPLPEVLELLRAADQAGRS